MWDSEAALTRMCCRGPRIVSAAPSEANLEAALTFANGATDGDNLPSTGSGSNPIALATTTTTNDTIRVTFGACNPANANLIALGTHTPSRSRPARTAPMARATPPTPRPPR